MAQRNRRGRGRLPQHPNEEREEDYGGGGDDVRHDMGDAPADPPLMPQVQVDPARRVAIAEAIAALEQMPVENVPAEAEAEAIARPAFLVAGPAGPAEPIAGPAFPDPGPAFPIAGPAFPVPGPAGPVAGPAFPAAGRAFPIAGPAFSVAGRVFPVAGPSEPVAGPSSSPEPVARPAPPREPVAGPAFPVAGQAFNLVPPGFPATRRAFPVVRPAVPAPRPAGGAAAVAEPAGWNDPPPHAYELMGRPVRRFRHGRYPQRYAPGATAIDIALADNACRDTMARLSAALVPVGHEVALSRQLNSMPEQWVIAELSVEEKEKFRQAAIMIQDADYTDAKALIAELNLVTGRTWLSLFYENVISSLENHIAGDDDQDIVGPMMDEAPVFALQEAQAAAAFAHQEVQAMAAFALEEVQAAINEALMDEAAAYPLQEDQAVAAGALMDEAAAADALLDEAALILLQEEADAFAMQEEAFPLQVEQAASPLQEEQSTSAQQEVAASLPTVEEAVVVAAPLVDLNVPVDEEADDPALDVEAVSGLLSRQRRHDG